MTEIDDKLIAALLDKASANPRLRQNYDLRTICDDTSQRMLNALMPGTQVPIHRHEETSETVVCISGMLDEVIYRLVPLAAAEEGPVMPRGMDAQDVTRPRMGFVEERRIRLCPAEGKYGCQVPKGAWHTVEVLEPSVIFEAKDGKYVG